ncbi:MAG: acyltransferase [Syntrophorhabdus sp.]
MGFIGSFILKIRRRETPFYRRLYAILIKLNRLEFPFIRPLHALMYQERKVRILFFRWLSVKLYYEPLFKSQCVSVGRNFKIIRGALQGIPYMSGKLFIEIGDNVTLHSVITFAGNKVYDQPKLKIGNNTYIGARNNFAVAQEITIGNNCYFADDIIVRDNDGHPVDYLQRRANMPVSRHDVKPVRIGDDVWIGSNVTILKGVTIGDRAIVAAHSLVKSDVPPDTVVGGNPAKVIKDLPSVRS